jgi:hypothetical protein
MNHLLLDGIFDHRLEAIRACKGGCGGRTPFYVVHVGWTTADAIQVGQKLVGVGGAVLTVFANRDWKPDGGVVVYNFRSRATTRISSATSTPNRCIRQIIRQIITRS